MIDCFNHVDVEGNYFPLNSYSRTDFLDIYNDIIDIFTNSNSGIKLIVLSNSFSNRTWELHNLQEVKDQLGLLILFA